MASPSKLQANPDPHQNNIRIDHFEITGLFGEPTKRINFPYHSGSSNEPSLLILMGPNGCGKTTILNMIKGALALDFDEFRRVPFDYAELKFSTGDRIEITKMSDEKFPLRVQFRNKSTLLARSKAENTSEETSVSIDEFRREASEASRSIHFDLLDIHRSLALKERGKNKNEYFVEIDGKRIYSGSTKGDEAPSLARRVLMFIQEAQVNYRRFFSAEELELLPRILERLQATNNFPVESSHLSERISRIRARFPIMKRFGLHTDDADLDTLENILSRNEHFENVSSRAVIESYVEMIESKSRAKELVATRLVEFEKIMDDFLVGKEVRVDWSKGLVITSHDNELKETDLSSGEYHFLFMMVSALLCYRTGSIIAIDEPELSLHVKWQRKIVGALARCASGASPLFIFATHSSTIGAQHKERVQILSAEEA